MRYSNIRSAPKALQRGVSLVQLAFIIGIGGIFLVFAAVFGPRYFMKVKVQNEVSALSDFRANVVSYGARVGLFSATNAATSALVGQNFFPANMVSGTTVSNQWGGTYETARGRIVNDGDSIILTSNGVPAQACTELGTSLDGIASIISINGTEVKANGASARADDVAGACGGANGDNNAFALTVAK